MEEADRSVVAVNGEGTSSRRKELGAFLKARRQALKPEGAGLPLGRRRVTHGLRREEVAALANIGVTWYTWLEQGRSVRPSADVLSRLAEALRLSSEESTYLFSLADRQPAVPHRLVMWVPDDLQALLDAFGGNAFALNARMDHLAWNRQAEAAYEFVRGGDWKRLNHIWRMFCDPKLRRIIGNWEEMAIGAVAIFRSLSAQHGPDPQIDALTESLKSSADFARAWAETAVGRAPATLIRLNTPAGILSVKSMAFNPPALPGIVVFFQTPVDDRSLGILLQHTATWTAQNRMLDLQHPRP